MGQCDAAPLDIQSSSESFLEVLAASCWTLMLVLGAAAQTAPSASAQTQSEAAIATWDMTGSAPQTGSSTYTSGKAFKAPDAEQGATASESQAKPITRSLRWLSR